MTKFLPLALLTGAALASATAATAATPPKPVVAAHVTKTTHVVTTRKVQSTTGAKPAGKTVTAKLANGRTVTYNCALKGNATKQACK